MDELFARSCAYWNRMRAHDADLYHAALEKINKDINAFVSLESAGSFAQKEKCAGSSYAARNAASVLSGIPCAVKDNIAHENKQLTCASRILEHFVSPYTATALQQLLDAGVFVVGRTNMDEFAMGSDTTHSIYGRTNNPWNTAYTPGGSSGGSAAAVAAGCVPFALGSDTGGSVRQPASFCGIWGLKPSYGAVSRYGLVAFASSLDVIGILAESLTWIEEVFNVIKVRGRDARDASSFYPEERELPSAHTKIVGVYRPQRGELHDVIQNALESTSARCKQLGYEVVPIELPMLEYSPAVYLNIAAAEASSNLARFDGIRYGTRPVFSENRIELIRKARSAGFSSEVTLRMLTGAFALRSGFQDQCYIKAQKLRKHMQKTFASLFSAVDVMVLPTFPTAAFRFDDTKMDSFHQKLGDAYSVVANLTGIPGINIPVSFQDSLPVSVQTVAPMFAEARLFAFARRISASVPYEYSSYAQTMFKDTNRTDCNYGSNSAAPRAHNTECGK